MTSRPRQEDVSALSRTAPMPRRRALALGLAATGALAGCARIPTSGPIQQVEPPAEAGGEAPYVQPRPPQDGDSPVQVVRGFLQAGLSREDNAATARQYLSGELNRTWDPASPVIVYSGAEDVELTVEDPGDRVILSALVRGRVEEHGTRSILDEPERITAAFQLAQVDGQWRIVQAPAGSMVSDAVFPLLFAPVRLYFLDQTRRHLVPDIRWFSAQGQAASVLSGLAAGPSAALAGAVVNAVPSSDAVADAPLVQAADGGARVLLPAVVESLPENEQRLAVEQIRASLGSIADLTDVQIAAGDRDIPPADSPTVPLPGHRPIGAGERGIISLSDPSAGSAAVQMVPDLADIPLAAPVIGPSGTVAAALAASGAALHIAAVDGSVPARSIPLDSALAAPRVDSRGWVWEVPLDTSGTMRLRGLDPKVDTSIRVPWLEGDVVRTIDVAVDATRILVLSVRDSETRLQLAGIRRDASGAPVELSEPVLIGTGLRGETQALWFDELRILLLGTDAETSTLQVVELDMLHGHRQAVAAPQEAWRIAGTDVSEFLWVATAEGALHRGTGRRWDEVALRALDPWVY